MALDLHAGPALRSATLYSPKANANACPGVPHSFRPARLTVVSRRETYFPSSPSTTDTGLRCVVHTSDNGRLPRVAPVLLHHPGSTF